MFLLRSKLNSSTFQAYLFKARKLLIIQAREKYDAARVVEDAPEIRVHLSDQKCLYTINRGSESPGVPYAPFSV